MGRPRVEKIKIGDRYISRENIEAHQKFNPATGCIEWTGVKNSIGYPFIGYTSESMPRGGMMTAHRIVLALKLGRPIAPGHNANHSCHNRLCMTPEHLSEGTQKQKRADMVRDGIHGQRGGNCYAYNHKQKGRNYKFTEAEIQWVRNASIDELVAKYNITRGKASSRRHLFRNGYKWLPWDKK
jgi:hypothetical protein